MSDIARGGGGGGGIQLLPNSFQHNSCTHDTQVIYLNLAYVHNAIVIRRPVEHNKGNSRGNKNGYYNSSHAYANWIYIIMSPYEVTGIVWF